MAKLGKIIMSAVDFGVGHYADDVRDFSFELKANFDAEAGEVMPVDTNWKEPAFIIVVKSPKGRLVEAGTLWALTGEKSGKVYYKIWIDLPSFNEPLALAGFQDKDKQGEFVLVWEREQKQTDEAA